jgi:hypothetical protein
VLGSWSEGRVRSPARARKAHVKPYMVVNFRVPLRRVRRQIRPQPSTVVQVLFSAGPLRRRTKE